jgi:CdiI N-terminal domain
MPAPTDDAPQWYPFEDGATLGTVGSESGIILRDEEHPAGTRISLERDGRNAPFAITCGIYGGRFLHTVFAASEAEALTKYDAMRTRLAELASRDDDIYDDLHAFIDQFPTLAHGPPLPQVTLVVGRRMAPSEPAFAIGFAGSELDEDGHGLGFIRIGDFSEEFVVTLNYWPAARYTQQWHASLKRLLVGSTAVGLATWMVAPESGDPGKAWILYREGDTVFIHEQLFVPPDFRLHLDADLQLLHIPPRTTVTEDGTPISEWRIDLAAIEDFLCHCGTQILPTSS